MSRILLDTHVWLWWLTGDDSLTDRERTALDTAAESAALAISAISLWEVQMLHYRKRLQLPLGFAEWLERAAAPEVIGVIPVDTTVVVAIDQLPGTFHGDPADRLIVATARAHAFALATRDSRIRRSRLVQLWKPGK